MTDRPAHLDDLLEFVTGGLASEDPLPPYSSPALDALTDALQDDAAPSPASAFTAAKYVLAAHARELGRMVIAKPAPEGVDARFWADAQLREYATSLDGQTPKP
ncbi:hypothetical protein [Streptomyces sp. NPDC059916]|uniref:hypothetical protein n=1 Tax=Streptomyces sp. NPDC059916 TaxID=3347001 RepID=UPI0036ABFC63